MKFRKLACLLLYVYSGCVATKAKQPAGEVEVPVRVDSLYCQILCLQEALATCDPFKDECDRVKAVGDCERLCQ